jgi:hypothetical protein
MFVVTQTISLVILQGWRTVPQTDVNEELAPSTPSWGVSLRGFESRSLHFDVSLPSSGLIDFTLNRRQW